MYRGNLPSQDQFNYSHQSSDETRYNYGTDDGYDGGASCSSSMMSVAPYSYDNYDKSNSAVACDSASYDEPICYVIHNRYEQQQKQQAELQQCDTQHSAVMPTKTKREPKCSLCANHSIDMLNSGHKHYCQFQNCPCEKCSVTKDRRDSAKKQQKNTRRLKYEKERNLESLNRPYTFPNPDLHPPRRDHEYPQTLYTEMIHDLGTLDNKMFEELDQVIKTKNSKKKRANC